jgi:hypothetical protein
MDNKMDVPKLIHNVESILTDLSPAIDSIRDLQGAQLKNLLTLVAVSIVVRQYDSLEAMTHLVSKDRAYACVGMLRPACEELVWLKYLVSIDVVKADQLLKLMAALEAHDALKAQDSFAGSRVTTQLGLKGHLAEARKTYPISKKALSEIGRDLGWPDRTTKNGDFPSMSFLAKRVGERKMYEFLYHASSRFVHFSAAEVLRRVWYSRSGNISVRSDNFSNYWGSFSLFWGLSLFLKTFAAAPMPPQFEFPDDADAILRATRVIGELGQVPIITVEELAT